MKNFYLFIIRSFTYMNVYGVCKTWTLECQNLRIILVTSICTVVNP